MLASPQGLVYTLVHSHADIAIQMFQRSTQEKEIKKSALCGMGIFAFKDHQLWQVQSLHCFFCLLYKLMLLSSQMCCIYDRSAYRHGCVYYTAKICCLGKGLNAGLACSPVMSFINQFQ